MLKTINSLDKAEQHLEMSLRLINAAASADNCCLKNTFFFFAKFRRGKHSNVHYFPHEWPLTEEAENIDYLVTVDIKSWAM